MIAYREWMARKLGRASEIKWGYQVRMGRWFASFRNCSYTGAVRAIEIATSRGYWARLVTPDGEIRLVVACPRPARPRRARCHEVQLSLGLDE